MAGCGSLVLLKPGDYEDTSHSLKVLHFQAEFKRSLERKVNYPRF